MNENGKRLTEMIASYLPSPPDPDLEDDEYYMLDSADRVIRVYARDIAPAPDDEGLVYRARRTADGKGVYNASGGCSMPGWYYKRALYDNAQDCREQTHYMFDRWEQLRRLQQTGFGRDTE